MGQQCAAATEEAEPRQVPQLGGRWNARMPSPWFARMGHRRRRGRPCPPRPKAPPHAQGVGRPVGPRIKVPPARGAADRRVLASGLDAAPFVVLGPREHRSAGCWCCPALAAAGAPRRGLCNALLGSQPPHKSQSSAGGSQHSAVAATAPPPSAW